MSAATRTVCFLALLVLPLAGAAAAGEGDVKAAPAKPPDAKVPEAKTPEEEELDLRICLELDEEAMAVVRTARRYRDAGNWRLAVEKYSAALKYLDAARRRGVQPVFAREPRLYVPLQAMIQADLKGLPPEGREVYGLLRRAEAGGALERAQALGDQRALERVVEDFAGLPAAPRALYLLGERARAEGQGGRALILWRRLLAEYPDWDGAERGSLLARAALVAVESGRLAEAGELLAQLKRSAGLSRIRVGAAEVLAVDEIEKRLRSAAKAPAVAETPRADGWPSTGGDVSHAGANARAIDAGACRWSRGLPAPTTATADGFSRRHAVASGQRVFVAGDAGVLALEAAAGRESWRTTGFDGLAASRLLVPAVGGGRVYAVQGSQGLCALSAENGDLVWRSGEAEIGAAAEFLKTVELAPVPVYDGGRVYCPATKSGRLRDVYLTCFDADSGRLLWWTFVCAARPFPFTEGPLPPAVGDGFVAVATNTGGLAVLEAVSGRVVWIRVYDRVDRPPRPRKAPPTRFPIWAPCAPVIAGGMLYAVPQDAQELMAFDLATGRPVWRMTREALQYLVGVAGGRLVCAGGTEAAAWSAADGRSLWRAPLGAESVGLGLLAGSSAIVPTKAGLQRLDLESGKPRSIYLYKRPDAEPGNLAICGDVLLLAGAKSLSGYYDWDRLMAELGSRIAARPEAAAPRAELGGIYFSEGLYDKAAPAFREALDRVKPEETVDGGVPLATAVRHDLRETYRRMVKASGDGWKRATRALDAEVARFPEAAAPRVEMGELLFWAEKYADAVPVFRGALERVRPGEAQDGRPLAAVVKLRIWECLLKTKVVAEAPEDSDLRVFAEAQKRLTASGENPFEFLRFARCREALGDFSGAVADYQTAVMLFPEEIVTAGQGDGARGDASRFARSRIAAIIASKGRGSYGRFDAEAAALLRKAREEKSPGPIERVIRGYPNSESVSDALLLLSAVARADGRFRDEAALLREHLWRCPDSDSDLEARVRLALAYRAGGLDPLCAGMLERLARAWPDRKFSLDGRRWSVREFAAGHLPGGGAAEQPPPARRTVARDIELPVKAAWKAEGLAARGNSISLIALSPECGEPEAVYVNSDNRTILALRAADGQILWKSEEGQYVSDALVTPRTVLALGSNKLRALSRQNGRPVWEFTLPFYAYARTEVCRVLLSAGEGVVGVVGDGHAVVLDEGTGLQVWASDFPGDYCSQAQIFRGQLLASTRNREDSTGSLTAYDLAGGTKRYRVAFSPGFGNSGFRIEGGSLVTFKGGTVDCWDLATGKSRWKSFGGGGNATTPLAIDDSRVVVLALVSNPAGPRIRIGALDLAAGKPLWDTGALERQFPGPWLEPAASTARVAVSAPDSRGVRSELLILDGATGKALPPLEVPTSGQAVSTAGQILVMVEKGAKDDKGKSEKAGCELRVWDPEAGRLLGAQDFGPDSRLTTLAGIVFVVGADGRLEMLKGAGAGK